MRVVLDLPDWVEETRLSILAGIEHVARKRPGEPWEVKTARCSMCGACCKDCPDLEERQGYKQPNGEWAKMCKWNAARPYHCCIGDGLKTTDKCTIRWGKV